MIRSPVILILGDPKSEAYLGSTERSGLPLVPTTLAEPIRRSTLSECFLGVSLPSLISYLRNGTDLSATRKFWNGSTTKPFLNLSRPVVGSVITRLSVLFSRRDSAVTSSIVLILVSRSPICFIV